VNRTSGELGLEWQLDLYPSDFEAFT